MSAFEHAGTPEGVGDTRPPALATDALRGARITVVGAGAFGGWTALWLLRAGAQVTLVDAWGAGHARSSSGDETRVIRATYGPSRTYTQWTDAAFGEWRALEALTGRTLLTACGALWMYAHDDDAYARAATPLLAEVGRTLEVLTPDEVRRRFPQFSVDDVRNAYFEHGAGFLRARLGCQVVAGQFVREGGQVVQAQVTPGRVARGRMAAVRTQDGTTLEADQFVFACGPWLGRMFPRLIGNAVLPTRQEVFYFGTPAGDPQFEPERCPVWLHSTATGLSFGIPGNEGRGMKVGDDVRGPRIDPTRASRAPSARALAWARAEIAARIPALAHAPVAEARTCVYENSPDGHLILDRHPAAENAWIAGGGSGHGYKLGPLVGRHLAARIAGQSAGIEAFTIARLASMTPA
ncbi:MAG: FAD-dependent oxidoreductase [Gemmatimonadetes bacterium]|nr:FAD-dependent oxidoreductase [Gemmatimonadota bacterium]